MLAILFVLIWICRVVDIKTGSMHGVEMPPYIIHFADSCGLSANQAAGFRICMIRQNKTNKSIRSDLN